MRNELSLENATLVGLRWEYSLDYKKATIEFILYICTHTHTHTYICICMYIQIVGHKESYHSSRNSLMRTEKKVSFMVAENKNRKGISYKVVCVRNMHKYA